MGHNLNVVALMNAFVMPAQRCDYALQVLTHPCECFHQGRYVEAVLFRRPPTDDATKLIVKRLALELGEVPFGAQFHQRWKP